MISISVIITCYNEGELLFRAVESLNNQTFKDFELIIVKDYSNHSETIQACKELEKKGFCILWCETNVGLSGARNLGIAYAKGTIIVPLDADDTLPVDALECINNEFNKNLSLDILVGNYLLINVENKEPKVIDCSVLTDDAFAISPSKLLNNWILLGTSPFKKSLWKTLGGYSLEFSKTCQDVDFFMRAIINGANSRYVNKVIYQWFKSNQGMNTSFLNISSLKLCYFRNYDFILKYAINNDAYSIAMDYSDVEKIKRWANKMKSQQNTSKISKLFFYAPIFIVPLIFILFKAIKRYIPK